MKKMIGIASMTLAVLTGVAQAKNLDTNVGAAITVGATQIATTSSAIVAQPIEGLYSSSVAVALTHNITGGGGQNITGGGGQNITGGGGHNIAGGGGHNITGGGGQNITGGGGHNITGGGGQ